MALDEWENLAKSYFIPEAIVADLNNDNLPEIIAPVRPVGLPPIYIKTKMLVFVNHGNATFKRLVEPFFTEMQMVVGMNAITEDRVSKIIVFGNQGDIYKIALSR